MSVPEREQRPGLRHGMASLDSQGEARRNSLLRRADWRFLVGQPRPQTSLVYAEGLLAESAAFISETVLGPGSAQPESCDLAVVVNPGAEMLAKAWLALRPGGAIYAEYTAPRPGASRRARSRIEAAGFKSVRSYWAWPVPDRASPAFWLPLDAPAALRFFLANRPPAASFKQRLGRLVLKAAWRLGSRLDLLAPVSITALKPDVGEGTGSTDVSFQLRWAGWDYSPARVSISWLLLTGGMHSANKVIALVFDGRHKQPSVVIKLPRSSHSNASLVQEANTLNAIQSRKPGGFSQVPQVVFEQVEGPFPALGETFLQGAPLYTVMKPENIRELALKVTGWLSGLVDESNLRPRQEWWEQQAAPLLAEFEHKFEVLAGREIAQQVEPILRVLQHLPPVVEQRDCSPWNVFLTESGELAVLDWEGAEVDGLPGRDLVYFMTYLAFFHEGVMESGRFTESYRRLQDPATSMGAIMEECSRIYLDKAGLTWDVLQPLRVLTWMMHACAEYDLIERSAGGQPDPELLQRSLFVTLLKEELSLV